MVSPINLNHQSVISLPRIKESRRNPHSRIGSFFSRLCCSRSSQKKFNAKVMRNREIESRDKEKDKPECKEKIEKQEKMEHTPGKNHLPKLTKKRKNTLREIQRKIKESEEKMLNSKFKNKVFYREIDEKMRKNGELSIEEHNRRWIDSVLKIQNKLKKELNKAQTHLTESYYDSSHWLTSNPTQCKGIICSESIIKEKELGEVSIAYTPEAPGSEEDFYSTSIIYLTLKNSQILSIPVYGVFDGSHGKYCASYFQEYTAEYLKDKLQQIIDTSLDLDDFQIFNALKTFFGELGDTFRKDYIEHFTNPNDEMDNKKKQSGDPIYKIPVSNATVAFKLGNDIWVANCGNSRAVLSVNGKAVALSTDSDPRNPEHTKSALKRGARILTEFGKDPQVIGGMGVSETPHALGYDWIAINPRPKITKYPCPKGNVFLILATRGLWLTGSSENVVEYTEALRKVWEEKPAGGDFLTKVLAKNITKRGYQSNPLIKEKIPNIVTMVVDLSEG